MHLQVFYSPHACVIPETLDPGCDAKSDRFAMILASQFPGSRLISSTVPRAVLDNNRLAGRNSHSRQQLRRLLPLTSRVFEVHTFHPTQRPDWGQVTILYLPGVNDGGWVEGVARDVREKTGLSVAVLEGTRANDIQLEAGPKGVLLELSQTLTDAQVRGIGVALAAAAP